MSKPVKGKGSRPQMSGDNHYAAKNESELRKINDAFCRKANGLHRLEVALFKWLGKDGADPVIRAAINQAREAQQDTDFQPLWDLLDERARNADTCAEEHY
uniref:Uncharacterized protein n=1 Tax=Pseudomonas phage HRDY3 TaxID=3236930 RepID=A0AB39CDC3_9VIRU